MRELKTYLVEQRSDDIAENVLRRLLSYAIGRNLDWRDRFAVQDLLDSANQRNAGLQDMIVMICQSRTFRADSE